MFVCVSVCVPFRNGKPGTPRLRQAPGSVRMSVCVYVCLSLYVDVPVCAVCCFVVLCGYVCECMCVRMSVCVCLSLYVNVRVCLCACLVWLGFICVFVCVFYMCAGIQPRFGLRKGGVSRLKITAYRRVLVCDNLHASPSNNMSMKRLHTKTNASTHTRRKGTHEHQPANHSHTIGNGIALQIFERAVDSCARSPLRVCV